ncbi:MAG: ethylbenzene dioxygenase beta subunit [Planctomycetota bacterium]
MSDQDLQLHHEIEQFLYREALLLDKRQFDEWLALFTGNATYWVPAVPDQDDPINSASIIYEDVPLLRMRIARISHPHALSLNPVTQTIHSISNVLILAINKNSVSASANLIVGCQRLDQDHQYFARSTYELRRDEGQFKIESKRVDLVGCDGAHEVISVLF